MLPVISQLVEQMNKMNSHVDFIKKNVLLVVDNKNGKQVSFSDQLPLQATANLRNQGATSSLTHYVNHVHIDDKLVETTLALSSLQIDIDLPDPYKDHPFHQGPIDKERPILMEQDNDSEDKEE